MSGTMTKALGGASMTKMIPLPQGKFSKVDDSDYETQFGHTWYLNNGYAVRYKNGKYIYLHREIAKTPKGSCTDHINRDRLDNRRVNLRVCNKSQNAQNARSWNKTSGYRGVTWHKKNRKWVSQIKVNGKPIYLGSYTNSIEAARAYDKAAKEHFGECAYLNIKDI